MLLNYLNNDEVEYDEDLVRKLEDKHADEFGRLPEDEFPK